MKKDSAYIAKDLPKVNDLVECKYCHSMVKVVSVTADKYGGYYHAEKHVCIDLSKDKYFKVINS